MLDIPECCVCHNVLAYQMCKRMGYPIPPVTMMCDPCKIRIKSVGCEIPPAGAAPKSD